MRDQIIGGGFQNHPAAQRTTWFFFHANGTLTTQPVNWPATGHGNGTPGPVQIYSGTPQPLAAGWGQWPAGWNGRKK